MSENEIKKLEVDIGAAMTILNENPSIAEDMGKLMKLDDQSLADATRNAFMDAIEFTLHPKTDCPLEFLNAWVHGDTSEWPEFKGKTYIEFYQG